MDTAAIRRNFTPPQLGEEADRLYCFLTENPGATPESAAGALGLPVAAIGDAVRSLRELGLLTNGPSGAESLVCYPVDFARLKVVNPLQQELNRVQGMIDRLRADLTELDNSAPRAPCGPVLQVVPELSDVRRLITGLAGDCQEEVLASQPGGARAEEVLEESMERTVALLERGVAMRTLYQHTARFSGVTTSYVERVTPLGAEVRTLPGGFPRCIVFDRTTAIMPLLGSNDGAVVVADAHVVGFILEAFNRAWGAASPFSPEGGRPDREAATSEVRRMIVALLLQGESDKRIAQVMGISLRNCQRHISNIMKGIGARNRLHAGYLLSKDPFAYDDPPCP
ncbi:helix-turn-helix transcriptional regulator [Streptomyces sp. MUM 203J]|uniref:helix-turn-helix domain-containing protein n=1 Tax=Streptomyces sp. MUM 203J TaxID=2791990 RepID=UPI001F04DA5D|nr:helix-turn-helix transcriptional regulator [Streptomyces sp. MUM 203J]MCH0538542.1 helix-turn-helix transcriptional regulator [Streptomyces sp. MUM 203J]